MQNKETLIYIHVAQPPPLPFCCLSKSLKTVRTVTYYGFSIAQSNIYYVQFLWTIINFQEMTQKCPCDFCFLVYDKLQYSEKKFICKFNLWSSERYV